MSLSAAPSVFKLSRVFSIFRRVIPMAGMLRSGVPIPGRNIWAVVSMMRRNQRAVIPMRRRNNNHSRRRVHQGRAYHVAGKGNSYPDTNIDTSGLGFRRKRQEEEYSCNKQRRSIRLRPDVFGFHDRSPFFVRHCTELHGFSDFDDRINEWFTRAAADRAEAKHERGVSYPDFPAMRYEVIIRA